MLVSPVERGAEWHLMVPLAVASSGTATALVLIAAVFAMLAGGLWWWSSAFERRAAATFGWPSTAGVITACGLRDRSTKYGPAWEVEVVYTYALGSSVFAADRVSVGALRFADPSAAEFFAAGWEPGESVDVFVDPSDPSSAVLVPGRGTAPRPGTWMSAVAGCVVVAAALAVCAFACCVM